MKLVLVAFFKWTGQPRFGMPLPLNGKRRSKPGTAKQISRNRIVKVRVSLQQAEFEQTLEAMLKC